MSTNTPENLALENLRITAFDPHVCAKLYNDLVDKALALGPNIFTRSDHLPIPNNLPFHHPQFPNDPITDHLSPPLVTFLQECKLFPAYCPDACLLPFVQPLDPRTFWMYQDWRDAEENPSAICLFVEAPYMDEGGLFFDQETELARYIRFPWPGHDEDDHWMPLELIFRKWLKMWELGQICLDYDGEDPTDPGWSGFHRIGWAGDALCQLDQTLLAWSELLDAIIARMPSDAFTTSANDATIGLLSRVAVHEDPASGMSQAYTFAKDFLEHARRPPRLRSRGALRIAPALSIPSDNNLEPGVSMINTQIIFPAVGGGNGDSTNSDGIHFMHEACPFMDQVAYYAAGPTGRLTQKKLFQPFNASNRYTHCPWNVMRRLRLIDILRIWTRCIQEGRWTVGAEGVEGSIADLESAGNSFAKLAWGQIDL